MGKFDYQEHQISVSHEVHRSLGDQGAYAIFEN